MWNQHQQLWPSNEIVLNYMIPLLVLSFNWYLQQADSITQHYHNIVGSLSTTIVQLFSNLSRKQH